jgi:hypothetical protein
MSSPSIGNTPQKVLVDLRQLALPLRPNAHLPKLGSALATPQRRVRSKAHVLVDGQQGLIGLDAALEQSNIGRVKIGGRRLLLTKLIDYLANDRFDAEISSLNVNVRQPRGNGHRQFHRNLPHFRQSLLFPGLYSLQCVRDSREDALNGSSFLLELDFSIVGLFLDARLGRDRRERGSGIDNTDALEA